MYNQTRDRQNNANGSTAKRPREFYAMDFAWEFNSPVEGEGRPQRRGLISELRMSELERALAFAG